VSGANLSARGAGPDNPVASNADVNGRAQNRRVEVNLKAIPGQQYQ
jgi:outer membrane protein OmpA-like peptidoglycan-associated protein